MHVKFHTQYVHHKDVKDIWHCVLNTQASTLVAQQNEHLGQEMLNIDMEREKLQEEIKQVMAALEQV